MQDEPRPDEILTAVAAFLKGAATRESGPHIAFQLRVGANAAGDLPAPARRWRPPAEAEELARLKALLRRRAATCPTLNRELARRIRDGEMDLSTPGLVEHLWADHAGQARRRPAQLLRLPRRPGGAEPRLTFPSRPRTRQRHGLRHSRRTSRNTWTSSTPSSRREIKPLEQQDDNVRFFDHRREHARTDWDNGRPAAQGVGGAAGRGAPARRRRRPPALRLAREWGGKGGTNLAMAIIREHLAAKGLGLHNDLQTEHSIVGNNPFIIMFKEFATHAQYERYAPMLQTGQIRTGFGLTEPYHGSDATHMETRAVREERDGAAGLADQRREDVDHRHARGELHHVLRPHRGNGRRRRRASPSSWCRPAIPGVKIEEYLWTFNMPTDHPRVSDQGRLGAGRGDLGRRGPGPAARPELRAPEPHPPGGLVARRGGLLHPGEREVRPRPQAVRQAAQRQPGDPVAAGRAAHPVRDAAPADPQDRLGDRPHAAQGGRAADLRQGLDVQLLGQPAGAARPPTGRCRCTAASAIRGTSRSSTSTATTAATASPRARKRSRCARWARSCSATSARSGRRSAAHRTAD